MNFRNFKNLKAFTLIELLVVMGILGILMAVTILVINPAEYLKRARDTNRVSDLNTLKTALTLYTVDTGTDYSTPDNTVYVSLPDSSSSICATWSLPALPSPWVYKCVTTTNYRKIDGTGWVPINLASMASKPLSTLPVDPTNNSTYYYTFVIGGSFELTALTESTQGATNASSDGGVDPAMIEVGTNLSLSPFTHGLVGYWRFDEGTGTNAVDSSGMGNNGTLTNGPTWTTGKVGGALSLDGIDDYVNVGNLGAVSNWTIGLWFNSGIVENYRNLFHTHFPVSGGSNAGVRVEQQAGGNLLVGVSANETWRGTIITTSLLPNTWYHLVIVGAPNTLYVYLNGVKKIDASWTSSPTDFPRFNIGRGYSTSSERWFNGSIDDVRVYNRALSAAEVLAQYNATK